MKLDQNRLFSVAKSYGFTNLFLWENWLYRVMIAQSSPATTDVYLTRKTFNDLFYDLDHSDNGYNLTDNTTWSSPAAQTKMYQAVLTKLKKMNIFKDIPLLEPIEKVFDPSVVYTNGILMFGCHKKGRNSYVLTHKFRYNNKSKTVYQESIRELVNDKIFHIVITYQWFYQIHP